MVLTFFGLDPAIAKKVGGGWLGRVALTVGGFALPV
jgi:hypothetical protein